MGWLELLPLLKRLLPMLDRLAPTLEALIAGRFGGKAEAERVSTAAIAEVTRSHNSLQQAMEDQRAQMLTVTSGIRQLQISHEAMAVSNDAVVASLDARLQGMDTFASKMEAMERQNTSLLHLLQGGLAVLLVLLVAVLILLFLLLRHHA